MYFYGYFLIKFFILHRRVEAITWENFVPAKRDPGSTKEASRLAGMKRFTCNQFVIFKPLSYCFEETIGFDVKASFASRPRSRLIR